MTDLNLKAKLLSTLLIGILAVLALSMVWYQLSSNPASGLTMDLPGAAGAPDARGTADVPVIIGEFFERFDGIPGDSTASWPGFRGEARNNTITEPVDILLPSPDPDGDLPFVEPLWTVALGEGHAGAAVHNGLVYVLDYDEEAQADALRCFSLDDGREVWRRWYAVKTKRNHGMSRTIPAVNDRYVVSIGPKCQVMCVDAVTGDYLWGLDLVADFGAEVPLWYTGQCPLLDGDQAVIAVGGKQLIIGVDCATGDVVWETPNPKGDRMSHSSVMMMDIGGTRTYVYAALGAIVGVSAEEIDRGTLLWESRDFDAKVIAPSPVATGDDTIFATAGYGAGSILIRVVTDGDGYEVNTVYRTRPVEGFSCEQQTPLVYDGLLYGILPKDAGPLREQFVCFDPSGLVVWSSGEENRFGLGPYLYADGKFIILSDAGVLTVIEASDSGYRELGRARILTGVDAWAPIAVVGSMLIARDSATMVCVDLGAGA